MLKLKRLLPFLALFAVPCLLSAAFASAALAAPFGFSSVGFSATEAPATQVVDGNQALGAPDVQAGSHPWELTTNFVMNNETENAGSLPTGDLKDLSVELPPGLIGNATVIPQCTIKQFDAIPSGYREFTFSAEFFPGEFIFSSYLFSGDSCPPDTEVGILDYRTNNGGGLGDQYFGVYNLVPPPGVPAAFGSSPLKIPVIFKPTVRSGGDYGLTVTASNIPQVLPMGGSTVTFWGEPSDPSHDPLRGECLGETGQSIQEFPHQCKVEGSAKPFLTMPTSCTAEPLTVTFHGDSWPAVPGSNDGHPEEVAPLGSYVSQSASAQAHLPAMTGCAHQAFAPKITLAPDTAQSDTPAGLTAEVKTAQDGLLSSERESVAPADIKNTVVKLPAGIAINPGQAAGLQACQPAEAGIGSEAPVACPAGSRVGTVEIETPLLRDKLTGNVYVLPNNPPHLQLLIAASADGVNLKLLADVDLDEATGQITTKLVETPPLPFTDFKLSFNGGAQAALVTPATCGTYSSSTDFTPWSSPFEADIFSSGSFGIETGPGGSGPAGCTGPLPFAPALTAGATTDQAGGSTDFSLLLQRGDGQQRISALQFNTPPGLLGKIAGVPLCPEPQASLGKCSVASQIGHTVVTAGPGGYPLVVPQPGQPPAPIYLTGPYKGAPFGLSIAVPVIAGPFNLGTVVTRASIAVDPHTAQLTITTDSLPQILDGVPTDLRTINAVIDRSGFMFNPTNCTPSSFSGTASSADGATATISTPFQVGSCRSLPFAPKLTASTQGRTSKKNGASLKVKLVQAAGSANIHTVKVDLPKQLPSRLTTLQKACLAKVFEANPANCPAASVVGSAKAITPVLPVPVSGPVYFVSHGGEAFPSLIVVLQGYGVTVELVGTTFISRAGITSSTFKTVPDVPVSTFELSIPEGPYSALAANGNLCAAKLAMPTAFTAQNGAQLKQSTRIAITGCPGAKSRAKRASRKQQARKANNHRRVKQ
jgi:hypothetical protein